MIGSWQSFYPDVKYRIWGSCTIHPTALKWGMTASQNRPLIGVTVDFEEAGGYSNFPWYALRENYSQIVVKTGGMPIFLPHEPAMAEEYVDRIDGLIITGGAFDVNPSLYCNEEVHETVNIKENRTDFELAVTQHALRKDIPVLGICGGQQLLKISVLRT